MQLAKDRRIPYYFVAFFLGLAVIDGIMVTLAVRTQTGTVIEHPYETGLRYNDLIAASDKQAELGWKATLDFVPQGNHQGLLRMDLRDADAAPIAADSVTITLMRPTQAGHDFTATLQSDGAGYSAPVQFPMPGLWELRAYVEAHGQHYQHAKRIVVE
jgi:nitrogen fixation protein FixH